jgi:hypothetical protein
MISAYSPICMVSHCSLVNISNAWLTRIRAFGFSLLRILMQVHVHILQTSFPHQKSPTLRGKNACRSACNVHGNKNQYWCLHRTQNIKLTKLAKLSTSVSRIAHHYVLWNCRVQWMKNVSSHQHTKTPCFVQLQLKLRTPLKFGNESDFGYKKVHYDFNFYASVEALSQCVAP